MTIASLAATAPAPRLRSEPRPAPPVAQTTGQFQGRPAPPNYYGAAQGKAGAALLTALRDVITDGHRAIGYSQARQGMFSLVDDVAGDDRVADVYSGRVVSNVNDIESAAQGGLNAEHTWPQSLGATDIAKSDLHQLMPSDVVANGKRGSLPYGEVEREQWATRPGPDGQISRLGTNVEGLPVFEPRAAVRGNIARALLYFYTRYDAQRPPRYSLVNFREELTTLLKWHKEDPVDMAERDRNDRIYRLQGNRNPYVDQAEFVDGIGFEQVVPEMLGEPTRQARPLSGHHPDSRYLAAARKTGLVGV